MMKERLNPLFSIGGFWLLVVAATTVLGEDKSDRAPDKSVAISEASWIRRLGDEQGLLTNGRFNVVFLGDSLTDFWAYTGKEVWNATLAPLKCTNLGVAADRTEHILFRLQHLDFRRAQPKIFVLLMGTNNLAMDPPDKPEDVARAIRSAAHQLCSRHPQSRVLILSIPPNGYQADSPLRARILQTNDLLAKDLPSRVEYLSLYPTMVDDTGSWREGLTLDGTHFSARGYQHFAAMLVPKLKEMLGISEATASP